LSVGHAVLLPPSRAEQVVAEVGNAHAGSYRWQDEDVAPALSSDCSSDLSPTLIPAERTVMIGCTSGSTGQPKTYPKLWRSMHGSSARNAAAIRRALRITDERYA